MVEFSLQVRKVLRSELSRAKNYHVTRVVHLSKSTLLLFALLTIACLVPVLRGKYYNLSADRQAVRLAGCRPSEANDCDNFLTG